MARDSRRRRSAQDSEVVLSGKLERCRARGLDQHLVSLYPPADAVEAEPQISVPESAVGSTPAGMVEAEGPVSGAGAE